MQTKLEQCPVLVVGCKKDQVESDRSKHLQLNAQVLNELKKLDEASMIDYIEAGLSMNRGVYKVPQDDLQLYLCKVYQETLPFLNEDGSVELRGLRGIDSYSESSDTDGGGIDRDWKRKGTENSKGMIR